MDKIKVAIRLRPFNRREIELGSVNAVTIRDNQVVLNSNKIKDGNKSAKSFTFDSCFDSSNSDKTNYSTQQMVYEGLGVDILESSMAGYNACIFAYGQTGSGKSFTMMGTEENKGLIPRLCEAIFERINSNTNNNLTFKVEVSYIEIYNEKVRDLLDPSGSKLNLKVREHQLLGPYVDGLTQLAVSSYKDIETILNEGNKSRTVAATNMNAESSRSHAVFCLKVSQTIADEHSGISGEKVSRISLVDLAGSEKASKTGVEGERFKEGCNINKSLHTLGQVISTLAENSHSKSKPKHIPYRDSVLTWLLKDSIGGNSKTVMVSTISPSFDNYEETLSTLRYADRAKRIVNNAVINEDPNAKIIRNLREELEMLKKELEKAKEQISADALNDRLQESEKLYKEISKPWNEKLAETEKIQKEWDDALQSMGISVQSSGIKVEKDKYYLVNLNADPSMNELLVYYLKDLTLVGRPDAKNKQNIQLLGPGIANEHCAFYMKNNHVCIAPIKEANTWVNGNLIRGETVLHHGDRIVLGTNHFFRINCPIDTSETNNETNFSLKHTKSIIDFNRAQEEVLLESKTQKTINGLETESNIDDENISTSSIFSNSNSTDESALALELAIQKFEQEYSNTSNSKHIKKGLSNNRISNSSSSSSINKSTTKSETTDSGIINANSLKSKNESILSDMNFRKGLQKLRSNLLRANSLCREANSLCKEMNKLIRFSVTLQIPAYNLTPNRERDSLLSEPAIVVKSKYNQNESDPDLQMPNKIIIDMEKFENYIFQLRETYSERQRNNLPLKDNNEGLVRLPDILTSSLSYYYNLIGVANLFLDVLYNDVFIPFEYDIPIINQQGEIAGRLKVKLQRLNIDTYYNTIEQEPSLNSTSEDADSIQFDNDNQNDNLKTVENRNVIKCGLSIIKAYDLPVNLNNLVFCQYRFWPQSDSVIVKSLDLDSSSAVRFDHEAVFTIETNEDFLEYCLDGALSIEVLCHRCKLNQSPKNQLSNLLSTKNYKNQIEVLNQIAKHQSLIDAWNEVSKSYELSVKILELNSEGYWKPVELKQNEMIKTGGVYQLKQGQSRQISVCLKQTKQNSAMWYNGLLFNLEPHRIDKISIGSILGVDVGMASYDSYQEFDLNKLKEKCKSLLEERKQYLYNQLKQLSETDRTDDEKERYESLCKQLVDLGEEQAAIDAPEDNSHLPGSTIEWNPKMGMEQHVPIIFVNLNDDILNINQIKSESEEYSDSDDFDQKFNKYKHKKVLMTCGDECYLKNEKKDSSYLNLKLVSWNDSSRLEMVDSDQVKGESDEDSNDEDYMNSNKLKLKAVARWDSSEHSSIYLNRETPLDKHVYLTVKINLKLKLQNQSNEKLKRNDLKSNHYIDFVLRKRICVCVYSSNIMNSSKLISLNRFKNILGTSNLSNRPKTLSRQKNSNDSCNSTAITYRFISNIPKLLTEQENRESLAIKAASSITEELISNLEEDSKSNKINIENSLSYFEQYAKSIEAVDSILKRDRAQQKLALKKAINYFNKNGISGLETEDSVNDSKDGTSSQMKKTFSVPNLIKNSFGSIKNLSIYNTKQPSSETKPKIANTKLNFNLNQQQKLAINLDIQHVASEAKSKLANLGNLMMDTSYKLNNMPFKSYISGDKSNKTQETSKIQEAQPFKDITHVISDHERSNETQNEPRCKAHNNDAQKIFDLYESIKKEEKNVEKKEETENTSISNMILHDLSIAKSEPEVDKSDETNETNYKLNKEVILQNSDFIVSSLSLNSNVLHDTDDQSNLNKGLSDQSITSTLTTTSATVSIKSSSKPKEPVIEEPIPEWVKENVHVIVSTSSVMNKPGFVRYIGPTKFGTGTWIGVELEQSAGKNDGSVKGVRYFTCPENKGVFVRADKLTLVVNKIND